MIIKVNGTEYDLNFGVAFIRELDKIDGIKANLTADQKANFGMAMKIVSPQIDMGSMAALSDVLYCAAWDNKQRPSRKIIDEYLDDSKTDLTRLFKEVQTEFKKSNSIQAELKVVKKAAKNSKA